MKLTEFFREELDREVERSRKALDGQTTVYLRLMGAKVPALYGPSADEQGF
jgi:hypothetical protein